MATKILLMRALVTVLMSISMMSVSSHCLAGKQAEYYFSGLPLTLANAIDDADIQEVKRLAPDIDLNVPGRENMTLLFYAVINDTPNEKNKLNIITELVRAGADPVQPVPDMTSVAVFCAKHKFPDYLKALMMGGMTANVKYKSTPIIFFSANDETLENTELLVQQGADVNARNGVGRTAIMDALALLQLKTVSYLLDNGGDANAVTDVGWGFASRLEEQINNAASNAMQNNLEKIRGKAISTGMKWPPAPR